MEWNRIVPVSVALIYVAFGLFVFISEPSKRAALTLFLILILIGISFLMIWSETGVGGWGGTESHGRWRYTPASFVRFAGWALLLFPIWLTLIFSLIRWMD